MLAFALFAGLITITPGLDTMLVLRTTAVGGVRAGAAAAAGIQLGCLIWATASALGVTAVLAASRTAYDVLRVAGALYLLWLGVRLLWNRRRSTADTPVPPAGGSFGTGLVTNLLNPKVGVFYLSVLPQFLPADADPLLGSLLLASVHVAEGILWCAGIIAA